MFFAVKSFLLQNGIDAKTWRRAKKTVLAAFLALGGLGFLGIQVCLFGVQFGNTSVIAPLHRQSANGTQHTDDLEDLASPAADRLRKLQIELEYCTERLNFIRHELARIEELEEDGLGPLVGMTAERVENEQNKARDIELRLQTRIARTELDSPYKNDQANSLTTTE